MLEIKIFNFSELILEDNFEKISFRSYNEGIISVHTGHESMNFKITPCKVFCTSSDKTEKIFFIGYGFASVFNNIVKIVGFPTFYKFEKFIECCDKLESYGKNCEKNFNKHI